MCAGDFLWQDRTAEIHRILVDVVRELYRVDSFIIEQKDFNSK